MKPLLEINDLVVNYGGIRAVNQINFLVNSGEITTLIGANGAGKSTILKSISQIVRYQGKILFDGQDLAKLPLNKVVRCVAHCPEGRQVLASRSVVENLEMGAYCRPGPIRADLETMFDLFPRLRERRSQLAGTLSGGEQQMVAIARALMAKPKMLLLDEPSLGLAPIIVGEIFKIIKDLQQSGTTILLVEQNARQALKIADKGYVLEAGKITIEGQANELLDDPRVRQAYLG